MNGYYIWNVSVDNHWYSAGQTVTAGHWSEAQRHNETGEVHKGASRHVHGYGNACWESGTASNISFSFTYYYYIIAEQFLSSDHE